MPLLLIESILFHLFMAIDSDFDYGEGVVQNAGFLHTFPSDIEFCGLCDATHGSLALKAYQQNLYLEYYY